MQRKRDTSRHESSNDAQVQKGVSRPFERPFEGAGAGHLLR